MKTGAQINVKFHPTDFFQSSLGRRVLKNLASVTVSSGNWPPPMHIDLTSYLAILKACMNDINVLTGNVVC